MRLTEAQRSAMLSMGAWYDPLDSHIVVDDVNEPVPIAVEQIDRALRVLAHLDVLSEEQIATLHDSFAETALDWFEPEGRECFRTLARALEEVGR